MRAMGRRAFASMLASALLAGCSSSATEPLHSDVDRARGDWLGGGATSYDFEVSTASSWFPAGAYVRVQVRDARVTAATNPDGTPVPNFTLTIDEIWNRLLDARARNQLNSAEFDARGVPVETDMGPWPVDGGVHYSVREFRRTR